MPACPECGDRLRRLSGRAGVKYDEQWICVRAMSERAQGGLGPFPHKGDIWIVSYVLRSPENRKIIDEIKAQMVLALSQAQEKGVLYRPDLSVLNEARPGDVIVDRALRTVYMIDEHGARRRCDDPEAKELAVNAVKTLLAAITSKAKLHDNQGK